MEKKEAVVLAEEKNMELDGDIHVWRRGYVLR